jgi:plastocyanin
MRTLMLTLSAAAALAVAGPANAATTKAVSISASGFQPGSATIIEGDTVTWTNKDKVNHQVVADRGQFVSAILKPGQKYSFTFNAAGTYAYHDGLAPKLKGTIVVKGAPPTLTFGVSTPTVVAGQQVTLTGIVSSKKAGEQVQIFYQPYPQPNLIQRTTVITSTGGTFSFLAKPGILTTYEAAWKGAYSTPSTVQVQPKISLGRSNGWVIHVAAGRSFAGRSVQLQRLNRLTGQWITLRKVMLGSGSSARVQLTLPKGLSKLRVGLSVNQAGAGYLGGYSTVVNWRQT